MSDLTKFAFKIALKKLGNKSRGDLNAELILDAICEDWGEL